MVVSCLYIFTTTHRLCNTKSDSQPWMLAHNDDVGSLLSTNVLQGQVEGEMVYITYIHKVNFLTIGHSAKQVGGGDILG